MIGCMMPSTRNAFPPLSPFFNRQPDDSIEHVFTPPSLNSASLCFDSAQSPDARYRQPLRFAPSVASNPPHEPQDSSLHFILTSPQGHATEISAQPAPISLPPPALNAEDSSADDSWFAGKNDVSILSVLFFF